MLSRTSSHMCGRWYLPTFLFRGGLLTLMYRAPFIALFRLFSSLPTMLNTYIMTSDGMVVKYGGGGLLMFFKPFTKSSWELSNIFLITVHPTTFVTVVDPTLLHHRIFIPRGHQEVFDGGTSSKVYLYTIVAALLLDRFTQPPIVRNSYVWFEGVLLLSVFVILFVHPHLYPVHSPSGVSAISQCSSEVVIFPLQLLIVRIYGFCSMIKGQQSIPNRNVGKYHLPHIWDEVLDNISELKLK